MARWHGRHPLGPRVVWLLTAAAPCARCRTVLQQYQDPQCTRVKTGVGSQQSWIRSGGDHSLCYDITEGFSCQFRCNAKLACEYGSGSGVVIREMVDNTCTGQAKSVRPLASHWTWAQAESFFQGGCVPDSDGVTFLKFDSSQGLGAGNFPNCSSEGSVAAGDGENANAFQGMYTMQFYTNDRCTDEYQVSTFSMQTASRFLWRVYRGAEFCYDYLDRTPRNSTEVLSRHVPQSIENFRLVCGNTPDMNGNGIRIQRHTGSVCSGRHEALQDWRNVFDPMNFPQVTKLFSGQCVLWSTYYVKFDQAWQRSHYPDCANFACTSGNCAGGRIATGEEFSYYTGPINTVKVPAAVPSGATAALGWLYALVALVQLAQ